MRVGLLIAVTKASTSGGSGELGMSSLDAGARDGATAADGLVENRIRRCVRDSGLALTCPIDATCDLGQDLSGPTDFPRDRVRSCPSTATAFGYKGRAGLEGVMDSCNLVERLCHRVECERDVGEQVVELAGVLDPSAAMGKMAQAFASLSRMGSCSGQRTAMRSARPARSRSRPMARRWIWLVPSKICMTVASRMCARPESRGYSRSRGEPRHSVVSLDTLSVATSLAIAALRDTPRNMCNGWLTQL